MISIALLNQFSTSSFQTKYIENCAGGGSMSDSIPTFDIAINRKFRNKFKPSPKAGWDTFNNSFENVTLTVEQLEQYIAQGHPFTSPHRHEHVSVGHDKDGKEIF